MVRIDYHYGIARMIPPQGVLEDILYIPMIPRGNWARGENHGG